KGREAEEARETADQRRDLAERRLYQAHILLARQAWEAGDRGRMQDLLDFWAPKPDRVDPRGWEWSYLQQQSQRALVSVPARQGDDVHHAPYYHALSPDGKFMASVGGPVRY